MDSAHSKPAEHDCVKRINALLAERNTMLSWAIAVGRESEFIQVATCKADEKKRGKPVLMFASHCPFCGTKLHETQSRKPSHDRTQQPSQCS